MLRLLKAFLDLVLWRITPAALPASWFLLAIVSVAVALLEVLGALLPHSLNFQMHQILLEAKASEQSARMVAMKNATDNAKQIIKDLTLEYNKLRQANITKELLEITTAQMAVG